MKKDKRKEWNKMNIQTRLKKGFSFTTILTSLAGVIAIIIIAVIAKQYSDALKYYGFSQGDIGKAMVAFTETRSCTRGLIGYTDSDVLSTLSENHDTKKESFEKYWSEVGDTVKTKAEAKIYDDVNSKLEDYWKIDEEIKNLGMNAADSDVQKQAEQRASAELTPAYNEIYKGMVSLMDKKVTEGDALKARLGVLSIVALILVIVIIIVSYAIAMKIGSEVAVGISTPLIALKKRLETFSKGDLESEFPETELEDEIADMIHVASDMATDLRTIISDSDMLLGKMAEGDYTITSQVKDKYAGDFVGLLMAMSQMKHQMNDIMSQINDASSLVAAGSNNLAQEMAEGAMDQSASIEELQATFADITEGVEKTSEKLNETYRIAQEYAKEADNSHTEMQGMVDVIARINETSKQIENIISEIEDIASQTNLLSLNAAIEAARAGEAGKGFAVVADQIRSLSEQSAKAAVDTRELIEGAIEVTNEGNEAAERVSVFIEKVINGMKSVAASSQELSEIADEQAKAMEQAEQGINQISEVVQSNSANAEETSATSEELSAQAVTMNDLISKFSLEK